MSYCVRMLAVGAAVVLLATAGAIGARPAAGDSAGGGGGIPLVPRWKVGDAWDLEVVRSFRTKQADKVLWSGRFTTNVTVTVKEARRDGFLVEWRVRGVDIPKGTEVTYEQAHARTLAADNCPLLIELSRAGNPTGLRNAAQVRRSLAAATGPLAPASAPENDRKTDEVMLRNAYKSDASLFGLVAAEMGLLTSYSGGTFLEGRPIRFETKLPSPFAGGMIPASGAYVLTKRDAAAGTATVASTLVTDPKRTGAVLRQAIRAAEAAGAPTPSEDELKEMDSVRIEDRGEHVVSRRTGWPAKFIYRRVVKTDRREWLQGLWITSTPRATLAEPATSGQADVR